MTLVTLSEPYSNPEPARFRDLQDRIEGLGHGIWRDEASFRRSNLKRIGCIREETMVEAPDFPSVSAFTPINAPQSCLADVADAREHPGRARKVRHDPQKRRHSSLEQRKKQNPLPPAVRLPKAACLVKKSSKDGHQEMVDNDRLPLEDNCSDASRGVEVDDNLSSTVNVPLDHLSHDSKDVEIDHFSPPQSAQVHQHISGSGDEYPTQGGILDSSHHVNMLLVEELKEPGMLCKILSRPQLPPLPEIESKRIETERPPEETSDTLIDDSASVWPENVFQSDWLTWIEDDPNLGSDNLSEVMAPGNFLSSCVPTSSAAKPHSDASEELEYSNSCFDDDEIEEDLVALTGANSNLVRVERPNCPPPQSATTRPQGLPSPKQTQTKSSAKSVEFGVLQPISFSKDGNAVPFLRPPAPKQIADRSIISGTTSRTVLRTSFRIGEALNAGAIACRAKVDAIIELYARVLHSEREANNGHKQFFQFCDLFTDKPPYLSGTYSLWKGVDLWDQDSRVFLEDGGRGKMCRAVGRIKRCAQGSGCEMLVLSVWEIDWEDVGVAKGMICA